MRKKLSAIVVGFLLCMLLGCSSNKVEEEKVSHTATAVQEENTNKETADIEETIDIEETEQKESTSETEYEVVYPMTVTDQVGRQVTIEKEPKTIVSGYYISTSLLIALGQEEKIIGVENNPEKRPVYEMSTPHLLELPQVGTVKELDLERCAMLQPDLLVLPFKLKDTAESLEQLGIPVIYVKPESKELLAEAIVLLGRVTNSNERAGKLQSQMDEKIKEMQSLVEEDKRPTVYITGNSNFLSTAGSQMYQHSLIEAAGGKNVAAEINDFSWAEISYEQLLAWNPEYIILAADAKFDIEDVLTDENLAGCQAVKKGNVYQIPNKIESWDSPVPGSILGSLWLASILHAEGYDNSMYEAAVEDFYNQFYGFEVELW